MRGDILIVPEIYRATYVVLSIDVFVTSARKEYSSCSQGQLWEDLICSENIIGLSSQLYDYYLDKAAERRGIGPQQNENGWTEGHIEYT